MSETVLEFNRFYRTKGLLKKAQLTSPPIINLANTHLPFWSALHYVPSEPDVLGLQASDPVVRSLGKTAKVLVSFPLFKADNIKFKFIQVNVRPNEFISKYLRDTPKWKRADFSISDLKLKNNVMVYNYGLIPLAVKLPTSSLQTRNQFLSKWLQVIDTIKGIYANGKPAKGIDGSYERNHIIMVDVPKVLPSLKNLVNVTNDPESTTFNNILETEPRFFIAELHKFLSDVDSIFSGLSNEALEHTNILFNRAGSGILVNLYILKHMGKPTIKQLTRAETKELVTGQSINVLEAVNLRKSLLAMFIAFNTKIDSGIKEDLLTESELDGLDDGSVDESNLNEKEMALLNEDDDNAPTEKAITSKFISDTNDMAKDLQNSIANTLKGKNLKPESVKAEVNDPSDDLEDIFNDDSGKDEDTIIEETLKTLEDLDENKEGTVVDKAIAEAFKSVDYKEHQPISEDPSEQFMDLVHKEADKGNLSAAEVRRFEALSKKIHNLKDPYGSERSLAEMAKIDPKELEIPEKHKLAQSIPGVFNDTLLESSHDLMHRHYIEKIYKKDILATSVNMLRMGYAIDNYEVRQVEDVVNDYEVHSVRFVPIRGKPSTLRFKVPKIKSNGTFKAGGNIDRMRPQRRDIPIRKVSPSQVALNSYHSTMWVERSPLAVFSYEKWLEKKIVDAATNPENKKISKISYGKCFDMTRRVPLTYSAITQYFTRFTIGKYDFMFDAKRMDSFFGADVVKAASKFSNKQVLVGKGPNSLLWMDYDGNIYEADIELINKVQSLGTIEDLLGIDPNKIPVNAAMLRIFSKSIPIGVVLGYWLGLGNLLTTTKTKFRRVPKNARVNLEPWEFVVKFQDQTLVFDRRDKKAALIMSGWNAYHATIKNFSVYDFDRADNYGNFFHDVGIEQRYERELEIIRTGWIDAVCRLELIKLNEPTDMVNLLLSAVDKLTYDEHPDQMDGLYQRDVGYERISGFIYGELLRSVRGHKSRKFMADAALDMPPDEVWYSILNDQTTGIAEFSNPIHSLKEQEVVVFRGAGGRSSRSMTAQTRKANRSNVGRDSEATVDSGDVATVLYTTANPNYDSVRGTIRYTTNPNENISRSWGTSQLLAPGAEYDDPPRRNFVSIQNSRTTNCKGATPLPVRTGYERVLAYRVDDIYASVARQDGEVTAVTNKVIQVKYKDGTEQEIELGLRYGEWSGKTMPHTLITNLKAGDKFKSDTPIAWNENFFAKDTITGGLIYKPGVLARVVLKDDADTWEDGCAIHTNFASKMETSRVDKRDILLDASQEIRNLLQIGDKVESDSILCTIFNPTEGSKDVFNQESLDSLRDLTSTSPQAKARGVITDIEVFYTGQKEDMSETIKDIVEVADAKLFKLRRALKKTAVDGSVDVGTRFSGTVLGPEKVLIRIKILTSEDMDTGSKLVVCHQMKSIVGRKIVDRFETKSGEPIDLKFSTTSFSNRIVDSGDRVGTTGVLAVAATKAIIAAYRGTKVK